MVRILGTLLVWGMFTAIVISLMTSATGAISNASGSELFGIATVIAAAAGLSTIAIWSAGRPDDDESIAQSIAKTKRRRSRRAEDLLASLDDEEVYDLEALLLSREGKSRQPPP